MRQTPAKFTLFTVWDEYSPNIHPWRVNCVPVRGEKTMAITVNIRYTGKNSTARRFAEEMISGGTVNLIRSEVGNLRYEYYQSLDDPETVLLIDAWTDQAAIDVHHASPMMATIATLREKYDLHMTVERYVVDEENGVDERYIRK